MDQPPGMLLRAKRIGGAVNPIVSLRATRLPVYAFD